MGEIDPRYTASQILRAIHHDQLYLFLGAAFVTVGIVAAAFSLLRRRLDPLLLWLALFAVLYGSRLWLSTDMVRAGTSAHASLSELCSRDHLSRSHPSVLFL